ncbi:MAG: hypothetical protein KAK00_08370 [Nanoarchaeota archaeon]|nr:hypothetical protein [Nanoarchaeota archaeon]
MPKSLDTIIYLELEKSKIKREKAKLVMDKSIALYFIFMLVAVLGFVFDYIDSFMLNTLIVLGIVILILGTLPYMLTVNKEEKKIDNFLKQLKNE